MSPRPALSADEIADHARQLVEATFRVIAATGNASPPVRPILQEAGLSRQVFYRCFESRDHLMAAVLLEGQRILAEYLCRRMAEATTPEEKVRAWVTGVMRQAQSATERTRPFVTSFHLRHFPTHAETPEQVFSTMLADVISAGVAEGRFESADPKTDALIIHDFVFDSMRRHLLNDVRPTRETVQRLADFALRGIGCAAPVEQA